MLTDDSDKHNMTCHGVNFRQAQWHVRITRCPTVFHWLPAAPVWYHCVLIPA